MEVLAVSEIGRIKVEVSPNTRHVQTLDTENRINITVHQIFEFSYNTENTIAITYT